MNILTYLREIKTLLPLQRQYNKVFKKLSSASSKTPKPKEGFSYDPRKLRNIGIMAHIDAGKTTTTERMLYFSGFSKHLGDVDDGDTITDYMQQERERGITICSAAVTFEWKNYRFNLIDTPGHVDFTYEVERCLTALDGAITVLDASAGVEAQTVTVWNQAHNYNIPCIAYVNKMDKHNASFDLTVESLKTKLKCNPIVIQHPIGTGKTFTGVVDLLSMKQYIWNDQTDGMIFKDNDISKNSSLYEECFLKRTQLIEQLADIDDEFGNLILNDTQYEDITCNQLAKAIKNVACNTRGVPVICGSSFKNKGVQPLLDSVIHYLPNPNEIHHEFLRFYSNKLCAMAFKIVHDKQKGPLTFLRIYGGHLEAGQTIYNVNRKCSEKVIKLMQISANNVTDLDFVETGHIVAVSGLRETISGDTLVKNQSAAVIAEEMMEKEKKDQNKILVNVSVPDPVFFCSIEAPSLAYTKKLDYALECLAREDPSLKVSNDIDTGQTILSGMGELHLEIVKDRILEEYGVKANLGKLQVSYRETLLDCVENEEITMDQMVGNKRNFVTISMSIYPLLSANNSHCDASKFNGLLLKPYKESELYKLKRHDISAINQGIISALSKGTILGFPVVNVEIHLHNVIKTFATSLPILTSAASLCISNCLKKSECILLEPTMSLEIQSPDIHMDRVLNDLGKRRSHIINVDVNENFSAISAITPLSELLGYASSIRTLTSGTATFTMQINNYQVMTENEQQDIINKLRF